MAATWFTQAWVQQVETELYTYYEKAVCYNIPITSVLTDMPFGGGDGRNSQTERIVIHRLDSMEAYQVIADTEKALPLFQRRLLLLRYCMGWPDLRVWKSLGISKNKYYAERKAVLICFGETLEYLPEKSNILN